MTELNAFITREEIRGVGEGVLSDRTVAVKDNISTKGVRTTCGSVMLEEYIPPFDATVVDRLKRSGAVIVGKTNMDEFGMGGTTETSAFGPTRNPLDPDRVPGGSSGGSAAAVASGEADLALGSDTGGSIRNPAAFCGVVGLKPTYGLVSRYGLVAYGNSLEQIGPIGNTIEDVAVMLDVIAGRDDCDATTREVSSEHTYAELPGQDVRDITVGVITDLIAGDEAVIGTFHEAMDALTEIGVTVEEVSLTSVEHAVAAYYVIAMAEASSNLARFDGVRYGVSGGFDGDWNEVFSRAREIGFGDEVKRRILLGTYALSAGYHEKYYAKAQDARAWIKRDFDSALESVDVLASPTMPVVPPELGERIMDPLELYLMDANTVPVNLANLPAVSVPWGDAKGFPIGVQFIGGMFDEPVLLRVGSALEQAG